jgi:beta-glucanase (GH16 family)
MFKLRTFQLSTLLIFLSFFGKAQVDVIYHDLVWSDEFSGTGAVDASKWFHQTQLPTGTSWYNGELQHYTDLLENSNTTDGILNIVAKKKSFTDQGITKNYTSARLNSKFPFTYGRVDIRAKVPIDKGTWPALWLLGKNIQEPGGFYNQDFGNTSWPACGEIDMMEYGIFGNQPANFIQSTLHTPSSSGNSVNHGSTIADSNIESNFHIYSLNWSPNQISFLLDGQVYYTYNPSVKNAQTWPFDKEQFLLLNIAMGGVAGTIADSFSETSMQIDYVRVYQNITPDTESPTSFTANLGTIQNKSIELLLNGQDNFGTLNYKITYNGTTVNANGASGVVKSVIINNLTPDTTYTFEISATDSTGNSAPNNPISLTAKTTNTISNSCSGESTEAIQGSFTAGYSYLFETTGTDVKFTFQLLDTDKTGVIAYLWRETPFQETPMTDLGNKTFTKTISGQTVGSTIRYAVKFAFAGGLSVTKYFSYVVGSNCGLGTSNISKDQVKIYPNPVQNILHLDFENNNNEVSLLDVSGKIILTKDCGKNTTIDLSKNPQGVYYLLIKNAVETKTVKVIKK